MCRTGRKSNSRFRFPGRRAESLEERCLFAISAQEQLFVYLLNRARHDPVAYQVEANLSVSLAGVAATPPVAVNDKLFASAEFHANEMAVNNYFDHQSHVTGDWPNKMVTDQGYVLPGFFPTTSNQVESLAAGTVYTTAAVPLKGLIEDTGINPPGHRIHLLAMDAFNLDNREIGVGHASNNAALYTNYWAVHLTRSDPADTFLTGVVFNDANQNGRYDAGEGLASVNVTAGALATSTNAQGGWSLKVTRNATYTVNVSGGSFAGTTRLVVPVASDNVEADFLSGNPLAQVNFGPPPNQPPQAAADSAGTDYSQSATIDVLANDFDPEGALSPATLAITQSPQHGTASIDSVTHKIVFTPTFGYVGSDTLNYTVKDSQGLVSNTAAVSLNVVAPASFPWYNALDADDVDGNTKINNLDAYLVMGELKQNGPRVLPTPSGGNSPPPYYDATRDGALTNADAFHVIARAKAVRASGEGEAALVVAATTAAFGETESIWYWWSPSETEAQRKKLFL